MVNKMPLPSVLAVKVIMSTLAGVTVTSIMTILQASIGSEDIIHALGHSIIAGVFAAGGAWMIVKKDIDRAHEKINDHDVRDKEKFDAMDNRFDKLVDKLDEVAVDVGELVGEARARRNGLVKTRDND